MTEGDLATIIWRACLQAGHTISVPASRHAAAEALWHLGPTPPAMVWPQAVIDLHTAIPTRAWQHPGLLANALRAHAERLEAAAHQAANTDAA